MSWALIALLSAAVSAFINLIGKHIAHRYARTPYTLPLMIGLAQPFVGVAMLAAAGMPASAPPWAVFWALVSGGLYGVGTHLLSSSLYTQEVSRAGPVYQSHPVFTALIAFFALGERLGATEWLAIAAVAAGAGMLSVRPSASGRILTMDKAFLLLLAGSAVEGSSNALGKAAVEELPTLFAHGLRMFALGGALLALNLRRRPWADVRLLARRRSPALAYMAANLVIANTGLFLFLWALSLGPAGPVAALFSSRALFLVLYSAAVGLIWRGSIGETTTPGAIALKIGASALIVAGAAAMALGSG